MSRGRNGWAVVLLISLVVVTVLASNVFAQPEGRDAASINPGRMDIEWHFRHELFQMLLEERGLTPAKNLEEALASPRDSVIVVIGRMHRTPVTYTNRLTTFVAQGGTVLVAADRSGMVAQSASLASGPITSADAATQYQDLPDCLRIGDLDPSHRLTSGVREIVINRSGWLVLLPSPTMNWRVIATVPQTCSPRRCRGQPLIAVSQCESPEAGTMILAADASLFTNSMLWHGDNAVLAIHVSETLCATGKRRLAFLVDGQLLPSYRSSPLLRNSTATPPQPVPPTVPPVPPTPPKPTLETTLRVANAVIQNVEESNILNEVVINHPRYPSRRLYPLVIMLSLVAILVTWLLSRISHPAALKPPLPAVREMQSSQELSRGGADSTSVYGLAAQTLARDFCRELAEDLELPAGWQLSPSDLLQLPAWEELKTSDRRDLVEVVTLARNRETPHISARRLQQFGTIIRTLRTRHRETMQLAHSTPELAAR